MSESGGAGTREVAYRLFAEEYDDATLEHSREDEERAPNYVITPTGARANRLFVVGVLTEVERVSDDVLRGRIVDPTGAFVVYAGQYQPDPQTFLERAEPPAFVAVTGKARTFTPDGSDRVLTSIRPESINEVDAATRDRWVVSTASHTVSRVATFADALARPERGDELRDALLADGVDEGLAEGIPLAIDHYDTTEAYLAAVRELAIQAAAVVAGERDEVEALDLAPNEGGHADVDLSAAEAAPIAASTAVPSAETASAETASEEAGESSDTASVDAGATVDAVGAEDAAAADETAGADVASAGESPADGAADPNGVDTDEAVAAGSESGEPGTAEADDADRAEASTDRPAGDLESDEPAEVPSGDESANASTGELYDLDEEERERVTEEYGTEFTTGTEVDEPGQADIETPGPDEDAAPSDAGDGPDPETAPGETPTEATEDAGTDAAEEPPEDPAGDATPDADEDGADAAAETAAEDVDLEAAAVDAMGSLDDGDGADRDAVVERVVDEYGADPDAVEDAIQDALMSGMCYEPSEDRLKAI